MYLDDDDDIDGLNDWVQKKNKIVETEKKENKSHECWI